MTPFYSYETPHMIRVPVSAAGYQYRRVSAKFRCSSALLAAAAAFIDPTSGREPRARANHSSPAPAPGCSRGHAAHTPGWISILRQFMQYLGLLSLVLRIFANYQTTHQWQLLEQLPPMCFGTFVTY